jgi:hypothetical protein
MKLVYIHDFKILAISSFDPTIILYNFLDEEVQKAGKLVGH